MNSWQTLLAAVLIVLLVFFAMPQPWELPECHDMKEPAESVVRDQVGQPNDLFHADRVENQQECHDKETLAYD
jgi:hypothetical protein